MLDAGLPAAFGLLAVLAFAGWCAGMSVVVFISMWRMALEADVCAVSSLGEKLDPAREIDKGAGVGGVTRE